jgi:hypothetical protein
MQHKFIKTACVLIALTSASFSVLAQKNLLTTNPGFEMGKKGWYYDDKAGSAAIVADAPHEGKSSLKIISAEGVGPKQIFSEPVAQPLTIEADKKYKLDVWVKPLVKTRGFELKVYALTGFKAGTDILVLSKGNNLKLNEWQLVSFDFVGKDYPKAKFSLTANLGEMLLDEFSLYEVK